MAYFTSSFWIAFVVVAVLGLFFTAIYGWLHDNWVKAKKISAERKAKQ